MKESLLALRLWVSVCCVSEERRVLVDAESAVWAQVKNQLMLLDLTRLHLFFVLLFCLRQIPISSLEIYVCICAEMFPVWCVCSCCEVPSCVACPAAIETLCSCSAAPLPHSLPLVPQWPDTRRRPASCNISYRLLVMVLQKSTGLNIYIIFVVLHFEYNAIDLL